MRLQYFLSLGEIIATNLSQNLKTSDKYNEKKSEIFPKFLLHLVIFDLEIIKYINI